MIVQAITAIVLSIVVLLLTWAIYKTLRKPMPGALIPLLIGATVIAYGIYSEYTWERRTLEKMPESIELIHRIAGTSVFSPWSYLIARTDQLSLIDTRTIRRHEHFPHQAMVNLLLLRRFNPVVQSRQMVDCVGGRRADLKNDINFDEQGMPQDLSWEPLPSDHRLLTVVCGDS